MSKAKKTYINIIIGILLFVGFRQIIAPSNGLTQTGVDLLASFLMIIYWWVTIGTTWTTVVVIPILSLTGIMSYSDAIASGLGNSMTLFIMMAGMMNVALMKSGCIERFILWFLTRKIVKNRPYMFIFLYMAAIYLVSLVMAGATVCIIMLPIIKGICDELGYNGNEKFSKCLYMLVNWVSLLGFVATPIGHSTAMICISAMESLFGYSMTFGQWMKVGIPISLLWFGMIFFTVRFLYKLDTSKFVNYNIEKRRADLQQMGRMPNEGIISCVVFFCCVFMFFVPDLLNGAFPQLKIFADKIGNVGVVILGVVILSVINVNGKPVLNFMQSVYDTEWGPFFMNISMYSISAAITSEVGGIPVWLNNIMLPLSESIKGWVLFVLMVSVAMIVITQFMACRTIMLLGILAAAPIAEKVGINPIAICLICCYTANMGLMFPPASGGASVVLSTDCMKAKDGFTLGWYALPQGMLIGLVSYVMINKIYPF